jgi:serine/threonine-protein kinase
MQSIEAGTEVDEGTKIDYTISIGPQKFLMPNYVGKNISEVETDLVVKDLIKGNVTYENSSIYDKDQVIYQNITPGTEVNAKSVVDFVVSNGNEGTSKQPVSLKITLPSGKDRMRVTVQKIQNSVIETVYEAYHSSSDSPINVPISGQGKALFEIYIDGALNGSVEHDFK